jgi:hypothetical protein
MALTTDTYDSLKNLIEAQIGSVIPPEKQAKLDSLINLAAKRAKAATLLWPRTLVIGEARSIDKCGYVAYTEDSYNVECGGTDEVNSLYVRNGVSADGNAAYTQYESDGTTVVDNLWSDSNTMWLITDYAIDGTGDSEYEVLSSATTPPSSGWVLGDTGLTPAPTVIAVSTVDTFKDMHLFSAPLTANNSISIGFAVDNRGAFIEQGNSSEKVAYSTHRKVNTDTYGDGTAGTVSEIPSEFFSYIALYTARQYQLSARPTSGEAIYTISSAEVRNVLEDELLKIEQQNITESVGRRMQTGINTSNTLNY